jgi:hypothetical protein
MVTYCVLKVSIFFCKIRLDEPVPVAARVRRRSAASSLLGLRVQIPQRDVLIVM